MRYAILYFFLFIVFVLLIAGPLIAASMDFALPEIPFDLMQPTGLENNDTLKTETGTAVSGGAEETEAAEKLRRMFRAF